MAFDGGAHLDRDKKSEFPSCLKKELAGFGRMGEGELFRQARHCS
jgi:hypothetical protein